MSLLCLDQDGHAFVGAARAHRHRNRVYAGGRRLCILPHLVGKDVHACPLHAGGPQRPGRGGARRPAAQEEFSGEIMFTWNGEAWMLTNAERSSNRVNDRQDELELVDAALIRVSACEVVTE